ncbi:MAG TPA: CDP-alcohol phosphatidyltransferase family protein [Chthoniobacteraceae bacterium]|jgi:phosphatidylglycerophosphate synthase|nr:CDP-alcohol phosphatidyltransferase family protein [Chthoniobacteraceae bacterium]
MDANRRPLTSRDYQWVQALARRLAARGVSPNGISIAGMVFATVGLAAYLAAHRALQVFASSLDYLGLGTPPDPSPRWYWLYAGALAVAAVCIQLRLMCNLLDGLVAVEGGRKGKAGNLFNEAPDRYADVVLLVGAGCAAQVPWLGWMAATFAVATAYARAFGASVGLGQDFCGPFAKPQRMFFLTMGTLASIAYYPVLEWTLWLIAAGSLFTFVRRIVRIYRQLP